MKQKLHTLGKLLLRFGLGIMWVVSGFTWLSKEDASGYLEDALTQAIEQEFSFGFYRAFLEGLVIPNKVIFAKLVSWGEFLVGISFLSGALMRFSAIVSLFLLINYALMNGTLFSLFNLLFLGLHLAVFLSRPGRTYGLDGYFRSKWPRLRWF